VKLFHKIAALVVLAAALPLATVGFFLVRLNERALEAEVCGRFDQTARHAAEAVAADVDERALLLSRTTQSIPWKDLDEKEMVGALQLLARQLDGRSAELLRIHDGSTEAVIASFRVAGSTGRLSNVAPTAPEEASTVKLSPVSRGLDGNGQVIASTTVDPLACKAGAGAWCVVAVEVPLGRLSARLEEVRSHAPLVLSLVESDGHLIAASPSGGTVGTPTSGPVLDAALHGGAGNARRFGDRVLGAFAPVGGFGWTILVEEDAAVALAAPRTMRRITLLATAAATLAALALAFLFARRLAAALSRLAKGAQAIAGGDLKHRIGARGSDEVAELAGTFDKMGDQLAASRAEIEAWNRELEQRVEAKTEELRQAQAQLVEAQKLAALGQLGAGVAHEINNPLGGVIGHVQLLLADRGPGHADHEALKHIEEAARRASQVVHNLLRFSVQRKAPVYTNVDLNRVVKDTLSLTESMIRDGGVTLELALSDDKPRAWGDAGQLGQVLLNLVSNARVATPSGGKIVVRTAVSDGNGTFVVEDTGKGISADHKARIFEPFFTTKDEWSNVGLGLSVSFRIVSEHRGKISVESELGQGARFTVAVPREPPERAS
jgi:signal transduction histidine kinase